MKPISPKTLITGLCFILIFQMSFAQSYEQSDDSKDSVDNALHYGMATDLYFNIPDFNIVYDTLFTTAFFFKFKVLSDFRLFNTNLDMRINIKGHGMPSIFDINPDACNMSPLFRDPLEVLIYKHFYPTYEAEYRLKRALYFGHQFKQAKK
jgi:hypothetical protein